MGKYKVGDLVLVTQILPHDVTSDDEVARYVGCVGRVDLLAPPEWVGDDLTVGVLFNDAETGRSDRFTFSEAELELFDEAR